MTGLPHSQGIQGNSGNFQVEANLRETQGVLIYFLNLGKFWFFLKNSGIFFFARFKMRFN